MWKSICAWFKNNLGPGPDPIVGATYEFREKNPFERLSCIVLSVREGYVLYNLGTQLRTSAETSCKVSTFNAIYKLKDV